MSKKIGIVYCQRIQDASCIGCAKCYKAVNDRLHAFAGEQELEVVFKTSCGDCPGLVLPKLDLQMLCLKSLDTEVEEIYFGTCVQKATAVMNCPMNLDGIRGKIKDMWGLPTHVGTHEL
jgi:predicted metal-binding protein